MFPEIRISDSMALPTYLLYLSLLYCFLVFFVVRRAEALGKDIRIALDLGLILMVGGFVGGRLLHITFESPEYYREDLTRIFKFWEGGFVFFGGFALALGGCATYVRQKKLSFLEWADFYAPVIALGYGLGRISCYLGGCCYGRFCSMPWATQFPWDDRHVPRHPTQLYAVIWELAAFALLISLPKLKTFNKGFVFSLWLILHGIGRLLMEYYRDDFRGPALGGFSVSSWFSIAVILMGIVFWLRSFAKSTKPAV